MPRKTCIEEFKRDAVALYENSQGSTPSAVEDLRQLQLLFVALNGDLQM